MEVVKVYYVMLIIAIVNFNTGNNIKLLYILVIYLHVYMLWYVLSICYKLLTNIEIKKLFLYCFNVSMFYHELIVSSIDNIKKSCSFRTLLNKLARFLSAKSNLNQ